VTSQGKKFVPTLCIPNDFYKEGVKWNQFSFSQHESEKYESPPSRSWSAGARGSYNLIWGSANANGKETVNTKNLMLQI
jgi:hypothetical protein